MNIAGFSKELDTVPDSVKWFKQITKIPAPCDLQGNNKLFPLHEVEL